MPPGKPSVRFDAEVACERAAPFGHYPVLLGAREEIPGGDRQRIEVEHPGTIRRPQNGIRFTVEEPAHLRERRSVADRKRQLMERDLALPDTSAIEGGEFAQRPLGQRCDVDTT